MSLYDIFETNKDLEENGTWVNIAGAEFKIRRANSRAALKALDDARKPYRTLLDSLERRGKPTPDDVSDEINMKWTINGLLIDWNTKTVTDRDGKPLKFTPENVRKLFTDLPDLHLEVVQRAVQAATFREEEIKDNEGNLSKD